ncbi:MAG: DUF4321 domain-containing protein [Ruminococcus sp.]|jgi:hypothetical protein|nr:DUF4321 domain-containing protein [Ruminococcus flavefaciens]MBQ1340050.1 DUF4321 domain-containing protein [Ruminococcus sp.]
MKKTLYMVLLVIAATFLGDIVGDYAYGSLKWLGYSKTLKFDPGTFIDTDSFKLAFGFFLSFNVCQLLLVLTAVLVYYKTAPKLISGK